VIARDANPCAVVSWFAAGGGSADDELAISSQLIVTPYFQTRDKADNLSVVSNLWSVALSFASCNRVNTKCLREKNLLSPRRFWLIAMRFYRR